MLISVNFARDGNSRHYEVSGWSGQEDEFVWSVGPRSVVALPYLNSEAELEVEIDLMGFDTSNAMPLRVMLDDRVVADLRVTGRQTIKFRVPPRRPNSVRPVLVLDHPVFRNANSSGVDPRPLAFCFWEINFYTVPARSGAPLRDLPCALILGNSHIASLRQGLELRKSDPEISGIDLEFLTLPPGHSWARAGAPDHMYDPRVVEEIAQIAVERRVKAIFSAIYGNGHFISGAIKYAKPFDFIVPGDVGAKVPVDREIVPFGLLEKKALEGSRLLLGLISILSSRMGVPGYHLSSPPPSSDNERLDHYVARISAMENHDQALSTAVETPAFRYKVWQLYERAAQAVVEEKSVTYLPPPKETLETSGFLSKSMEQDGFHANPLYGSAVLKQVRAVMRGLIQ